MERFWDKVKKSDGCWIWQAAINTHGYGVFSVGKKKKRAHRFSYEASVGEIPEDMLVLHKCDVRACVNPDHLFLGSHADNAKDRNQKGRQARGANCGSSKLNEEQVKVIKRNKGYISATALARAFGVDEKSIRKIHKNQSWGWL